MATTTFRAGVRFHTQDKDFYCGAAVAMMLFEHLGIGGTAQEDLYAIGRAATRLKNDLYIDPTGLVALLNGRLEEHRRDERYVRRDCRSGEEAVKTLAAALMHAPALPAFLLDVFLHWVLIDGVERESGPDGPSIGDLWVLEPVADLVSAGGDKTPPHKRDDVCGSNDEHGFLEAAFRGKAWSDMLQPQELLGGNIVVIVPAGTPRAADLPFAEETGEAIPTAVRGRIAGVTTGQPVEVSSESVQGGRYTLVPLMASGGQVGTAFMIGGKRQAVTLFARPQPLRELTRETAFDRARALTGDEPEAGDTADFTWRLSKESGSPFTPFRKVRFTGGREVHVRIDGAAFAKLAPPPRP